MTVQSIYDEKNLLSEEQLAARLNRSRFTLFRWRKKGIGPIPTVIGSQHFYTPASIDRWLASRELKPLARPRRRRG